MNTSEKVIKVKIINAKPRFKGDNERWYKLGEIYHVKPYRNNPEMFWELDGWDGNMHSTPNIVYFWIAKNDTEIIKEQLFTIPDEVFDD